MASIILKLVRGERTEGVHHKEFTASINGDSRTVLGHEASHVTFPSKQEIVKDLKIGVLFNGSYQVRRVIITNESIIFADNEGEEIIDFIPMGDIIGVDDLDGFTSHSSHRDSQSQANIASLESAASTISAFQIRTVPSGYNCGRKYCLQAESDAQCEEMIKLLTKLSLAAQLRQEAKSPCQRSQDAMRRVFNSMPFQIYSATLIFFNFFISAAEAQLIDVTDEGSGSRTEVGRFLDVSNTLVTLLFAVELVINLYAHWIREFLTSWMNIWDALIVTVSVASLGPLDIAMPLTILRFFRVVRILRVLKIFIRLPELKRIISALTRSLIPMLNAFLIVLVVMAIYAIIGVTYFRDDAPDEFGKFDRAFVSMFRITAGETWVEALPRVLPDGTLNSGPAAFFLTYIALVNWILVQVGYVLLCRLLACNHIKIFIPAHRSFPPARSLCR
jgi:hypothetical protein